MNHGREIAGIALVAVLAMSCGHATFPVQVRFDSDADAAAAQQIEVALVPSCPADASVAPTGALARITVTRGASMSLASIAAGHYGLVARAWDAQCRVVASGCAPVDVSGNGTTLSVTITHVAADVCASSTACSATSGICAGLDSGMPMDAGNADAGSADAANPDSAVLPDAASNILAGCVLRLRMDEAAWTGAASEVIDACGGDDDGRSLGGATTATDPMRGRVGRFNAASCIQIADSPRLRPSTALTVAAWVRPTALDGSSPFGLVSKRVSSNTQDAYTFSIFASNRLTIDVDSENDRFSTVMSVVNMTWSHVAFTYDGTRALGARVHVFIDGALVDTGPETSTTIMPYTSDLFVGCNPPAADTTRHFVGDMDDVVIWTRALSDTEVGQWYTSTR